MAKPFFEVVRRASEATCFKCYGALDDICASGFSPGHGAVQGHCCACRMSTYFDVADNDNDDALSEALALDVMRECFTY